MFKLTTPTSLPLLNLPASALVALSNEILGPVDDIDLFTAFWNETGTLLWHLNHDDTLPEDPLLAVALANPEYVTALDDGWYLLLGIVCDNGQGIYLVFPDTTVITQLQNLIEALNHEEEKSRYRSRRHRKLYRVLQGGSRENQPPQQGTADV